MLLSSRRFVQDHQSGRGLPIPDRRGDEGDDPFASVRSAEPELGYLDGIPRLKYLIDPAPDLLTVPVVDEVPERPTENRLSIFRAHELDGSRVTMEELSVLRNHGDGG